MTSPDLVVTAAVYDRLLALAREGAPAEICGVLAGSVDGTAVEVTSVEPVPNVAQPAATRYELDPAVTVETIDRIETRGDDHVGFYHSHPQGPPHPSATDEAQATWTGSVYAIVSLPDASVRAWRWTGDAFERLRLEVVDHE